MGNSLLSCYSYLEKETLMQLLLPPHIPLLKTPQNLLCCQICQRTFQNRKAIGTHITRSHQLNAKEYYDRYFKIEHEELCIICQKPTKFNSTQYLYHPHCSAKCAANDPKVQENLKQAAYQKYNGKHLFQTSEFIQNQKTKNKNIHKSNQKRQQTCREKYGVDYSSQRPEQKQLMHDFMKQHQTQIRENYEQTCFEKYGSKSIFNNKTFQEKIKLTNLQKYGVKNVFDSPLFQKQIQQKQIARSNSQKQKIKTKTQQTCLQKYGTICPLQNKDIQNKTFQTNIKKYGVQYPSQNKEIIQKIEQTSVQSKPYVLPSGKIIWKMGYEPQFLDYIFQNNILLENEIDYSPNGIKYCSKQGIDHYYFPDFYIPKWKLIIEIKSTYTLAKDKDILLKEQCVYANGYQYCLIYNDPMSRYLNFTNFDNLRLNNLKIEESNHV